MRTLGLFCAAIMLLGMRLPPEPATVDHPAELRAYWVDAFGPGLYSPGEIEKVVADARAANMNAIFAQVIRRADCLCNRSIAPRTDFGTAAAAFDPLQTLLDRAHAAGIEVHAWVIVTGMWKELGPPAAAGHIFYEHGPSATGAENWLDLRSDGADHLVDEWLFDPGHPDAADYMARMALSIVANYDIDGLNLDRIRYPDETFGTNVPSWGYNPVALARFQAATGRSDRPAAGDRRWTQWRRDQITALVRKIYLETYALKPRVRVSADTIAYGGGPQSVGGFERTRTYAEVLQDWRGWMAEGILDLNIVMNYKRDTAPEQRRWFHEWSEFAKDSQFQRAAAVGSALYLNANPGSVHQVREALAPSAAGNRGAGWVGYSYRTPEAAVTVGARQGVASREEFASALTEPAGDDPSAQPVFASAASVPAMPWKARAVVGHVSGVALAGDGAPLADTRVDLEDASGALVRTQTSDARGWFGFVDVPPGRYRVRWADATETIAVVAGQLAQVTPSPLGRGSRPRAALCGGFD